MRLAICENIPADKDNLLKLLNKYEDDFGKKFKIDIYNSGEDFLDKFETNAYEIIFLDIYMGEITGIDVARKIRKTDDNVKLIFSTTSEEFFKEGFEVNAIHYLVKPLSYEALKESLHRVREICDLNDDMILIQNNKKTIKIPQNKISYIETMRNGIIIHFPNDCISFRYPLSKIEEQLNFNYFLKCHRSYIVNMNAINDVGNDCFILKNGTEVLIRKKDIATMKQKYAEFYLEKLSGEI